MSEQTLTQRPRHMPERPLSPHLQVWGWTVTMASSITHRATGIALYGGSILLVAWLAAGALGEKSYTFVTGILGSPFGLIILAGFTWASMYHLCNGIRHLIWDSGHLISKESGQLSAWFVYGTSIALTAIIWAVALTMKG